MHHLLASPDGQEDEPFVRIAVRKVTAEQAIEIPANGGDVDATANDRVCPIDQTQRPRGKRQFHAVQDKADVSVDFLDGITNAVAEVVLAYAGGPRTLVPVGARTGMVVMGSSGRKTKPGSLAAFCV